MSFAARRSSPLAIGRLLSQCQYRCQIVQRRHARVQDMRLRSVTTQQPSAAVLEKYRSKLEQKARQEGLASVSELKEAYKEKIEQVRKEAAPTVPLPVAQKDGLQQTPPPPPEPQAQAQTQKPTNPGPGTGTGTGTGIKPLSSYIDVAKVQELPAKEIEYIWRLRFASDPLSLCAVVPLATYQRMQATARKHPQFILPLPRPGADAATAAAQESESGVGAKTAADMHFLQWAFHPPATRTSSSHTSTVIFTHLAAFKLHGTYAQPHTTITHHLDLADSHGIVLLNGGVVDGRGVSVDEGRWLLMCLQRFYGGEDSSSSSSTATPTSSSSGNDNNHNNKRQELLEKFSRGDAAFSLEELVDEAERVG